MKSVAFFRNSWKKKSKDNKTAKETKRTTTEEMIPASAPCTPATATFCPFDHGPPLPSPAHKIRSQSEEVIKAPPIPIRYDNSYDGGGSSVCSLVDEDITMSSSDPFLDCGCHSRANFDHNAPNNPPDGPPHMDFYPPSLGMTAKSTRDPRPVRPPRPPPLNLQPTTKKRPVNIDISPRSGTNRTVTPNSGAIKTVDLITTYRSSKDSPGRSGDRELLNRSSGAITSKFCSLDGGHPHPQRDLLHGMDMAANLPRPLQNNYLPAMTSPCASQTLLDLSDSPATRYLYRNGLHTSSTPHLLPRDDEMLSVPPLPSGSLDRQPYDDVMAASLSSFPAPPQTPLFARRKVAKILAIRSASPSPNTPLPISPVLTSEYAPLVTPTKLHPHTSFYHSKSYSSLPRHSSPRGLPPLLFDPPSTPLPTPPTSPGTESSIPPNPLRSVKSVNQLHSKMLPPIPPTAHRATSSAPVTVLGGQPCIKQLGHLVQTQSEKQRAFQPPTTHLGVSDNQTQWGYAF